MSGLERLVLALQEYGTPVRTDEVAQGIYYVDGVWRIPLNDAEELRVEEASLPHAVAELLALYAGAIAGGNDRQRLVREWLSGERAAEAETLAGWLRELGWQEEPGAVVLLEFARAGEPGTAEEAALLLRELIGCEQAVVARQGQQRVWVLVPAAAKQGEKRADAAQSGARLQVVKQMDMKQMDMKQLDMKQLDVKQLDVKQLDVKQSDVKQTDVKQLDADQMFVSLEDLQEAVRSWVDTLSAELFLLGRAGVSNVRSLSDLIKAREEAEFALQAGKLLRGKEAVHAYGKLGIARLLYGAPEWVRQEFVREILPSEALEALTPELRETAAAFVEHGQQVADTARALFVHRNTLLYRLERIHELTGCDPRHPLQGFSLWLALLLLRSGCTNEPQ